jgi:hypothetical protein
MDEKIEIKIEIKKANLSISLSYIKENLTLEGISMGLWYNDVIGLEIVMSPFFKEDTWHLLLEGLSGWVNDDFDEILPFSLKRDITEYRSDILKDQSNKTEIILKIRRISSKR